MGKEQKTIIEKIGAYKIGDHLSIIIIPSITNRETPSGEKISLGKKIGRLDIVRNVKNIEARDLLIGIVSDLLVLIDRIKDGSFPADVDVFLGSSHLLGMRIVEKLGFETEEQKLFLKIEGMLLGAIYSKDFSKKNLKNKWRKTKKGWITKKKLLENEETYRGFVKKYSTPTNTYNNPQTLDNPLP